MGWAQFLRSKLNARKRNALKCAARAPDHGGIRSPDHLHHNEPWGSCNEPAEIGHNRFFVDLHERLNRNDGWGSRSGAVLETILLERAEGEFDRKCQQESCAFMSRWQEGDEPRISNTFCSLAQPHMWIVCQRLRSSCSDQLSPSKQPPRPPMTIRLKPQHPLELRGLPTRINISSSASGSSGLCYSFWGA